MIHLAQAYEPLLIIALATIFLREHWLIENTFTLGQVDLVLAFVLFALVWVMAHWHLLHIHLISKTGQTVTSQPANYSFKLNAATVCGTIWPRSAAAACCNSSHSV